MNQKFSLPPRSRKRIMPTIYKHVVQADWHRTFTFKERLMILFGFNLFVLIRIPTQHNPGNFQPVVAGEVSKYSSASELMRAQMEQLLIQKRDQ